MSLRLLYLIFRQVLGLMLLMGRTSATKDIELLDTADLPLFPWHAAAKPRFVRVVPDEISGRRFHVVDRETWKTASTDAPRAAPE